MTGGKFKRWLMHSTTGPGKHSGGRHRRKCLPTNYTQAHDTVLRRPVESALTAGVAVSNQPLQVGVAFLGAGEEGVLYRVEDQVGGHRSGGPPTHDPATVSVDDEGDVDKSHPG